MDNINTDLNNIRIDITKHCMKIHFYEVHFMKRILKISSTTYKVV